VNNEEAPAATDDARTTINTITRIFLVATTIYINSIPRFLMLVDITICPSNSGGISDLLSQLT
jgi:hypothetical protein